MRKKPRHLKEAEGNYRTAAFLSAPSPAPAGAGLGEQLQALLSLDALLTRFLCKQEFS